MLRLTKFIVVLPSKKNVVAFLTEKGHRVEISKKFIKAIKSPANTNQYVFSRTFSPIINKEVLVDLQEYYILECTNREGTASISRVNDLISVKQINHLLNISEEMKKSPIELW